jgi:arylsulfatase A-like enzyme
VTHVPIILKLPGDRLAGTVNPGIARHVDVAPTILSEAGIPVPEQMVGLPLVGPEPDYANAGPLHSFAQTDFLNVVAESIRTHDAKLIRANEANPRGLATVEFYDLDSDPGERVNRASGGDPRQGELRELLDETLRGIQEDALR